MKYIAIVILMAFIVAALLPVAGQQNSQKPAAFSGVLKKVYPGDPQPSRSNGSEPIADSEDDQQQEPVTNGVVGTEQQQRVSPSGTAYNSSTDTKSAANSDHRRSRYSGQHYGEAREQIEDLHEQAEQFFSHHDALMDSLEPRLANLSSACDRRADSLIDEAAATMAKGIEAEARAFALSGEESTKHSGDLEELRGHVAELLAKASTENVRLPREFDSAQERLTNLDALARDGRKVGESRNIMQQIVDSYQNGLQNNQHSQEALKSALRDHLGEIEMLGLIEAHSRAMLTLTRTNGELWNAWYSSLRAKQSALCSSEWVKYQYKTPKLRSPYGVRP